jgi:hypothetical protein
LLLLSFSLFVQQALIFSLTKEFTSVSYRSSSHQSCKNFTKSGETDQTIFRVFEADLNEDTFDPLEKFNEVKTFHVSNNEIHYCALLRTKYLQQLSNTSQQPFKRLFVFQHSWKLAYA